jgi:multiple sugar transport system permease protein
MSVARLRVWSYYVLLWVVSIVFVSPVLWIALSAFKTRNDILATPPKLFFTPTLENFVHLFARSQLLRQVANSIVLSLSAVIIAIVVSFLAAFCFSRFKPKGTDFLMFLLLSIRMLPGPAVILPIYLMYAGFGWKDNHFWLTLFYAMFSIPFSVWILKGFIDGVSVRYDETGLVNGGSWLHVIFRVVLPQVKPGLIAAFIFNLIFVWNEFLFNFIIGGVSTQNIPYALAVGTYADGGVAWPFIASLTTIYIIPPVVFIYAFQKYLLVGMTFGTVRGEV